MFRYSDDQKHRGHVARRSGVGSRYLLEEGNGRGDSDHTTLEAYCGYRLEHADETGWPVRPAR